MRSILLLALLLLAAVVPAQRLAVALNDQPAGLINTTSSPFINAFYYKTTRAMLIIGAEFWCGAISGNGSVYVFANDATTSPNRPGTLLASGTFKAPAHKCWAGALFAKPIPVAKDTVLWLGFLMDKGGTTPQVGRSATAPTYWWTSSLPPTWNGPYGPPKQSTGFMWMYRLYEPGGTGAFQTFGQANTGTYGPIAFEARGWPNVGNPFTLVASNLKEAGSGLLVWGRRSNIVLPLGTLYAFPPLVLQGFTTGGGGKPAPQSVIFAQRLPNNPALVGAALVWQVWMLDSAAPAGLAHSAGLEGKIG